MADAAPSAKREREPDEADAPTKRLREDADDGEIDEDGQEVQRPPATSDVPASDAADAADAAAGTGDAASASALSAEPEAAAAASNASDAAAAAEPAAPPPGATAVPAYSTDAPPAALPPITDEELANLLRSRGEAKARRDFGAADMIRAQLETYGIKVVDARTTGSLGTWTDSTGRKWVTRARTVSSAREARQHTQSAHAVPAHP